jgi:hypothetical protein
MRQRARRVRRAACFWNRSPSGRADASRVATASRGSVCAAGGLRANSAPSASAASVSIYCSRVPQMAQVRRAPTARSASASCPCVRSRTASRAASGRSVGRYAFCLLYRDRNCAGAHCADSRAASYSVDPSAAARGRRGAKNKILTGQLPANTLARNGLLQGRRPTLRPLDT